MSDDAPGPKIGRPPSLPPLTGAEQQDLQRYVEHLTDADGRVIRERWEAFRQETQLEWCVMLRLLARRSHGRDAVEIIKLGANLMLSAPKAEAGARRKE